MSKERIRLVTVLRFVIPILITLLWLVFIYGNSLKSGVESGEQSGRIYKIINEITSFLGFQKPISEHFIRKCAHFIEFAILSILICSDLCAFGLVSFRQKLYISASILLLSVPTSAIFASIDETLQRFSADRGPSVADVMLDTSGALTATVIFIAVFILVKYIFGIVKKKSL